MSSPTPSSYAITITCTQVPETLHDVPLPIEIVSADGAPYRTVLTLEPNGQTTASVASSGRYLVRAELPSGQWVSQETIIPEQTSGQSASTNPTVGAVQLDFSAAAPSASSTQGRRSGSNSSAPRSFTPAARQALITTLAAQFTMRELHELCAELDIEQAISFHRKANTIQEIVAYVETNGRSADLIRVCQQLRPHMHWPEAGDTSSIQWLPHTSFDEIDATPKGLESQTFPPSSPLVLGESDDEDSFGLESTSLSLDLVSLEYSVFERWNIETNQNTIADNLVVQPLHATQLQSGMQQPARATLPAEIAVFTRKAMGSSNNYPLFVHVAWPSSRGDEAGSEALVLWPASLSDQPLILLPDSDPGINADAPLLLASVKSGDNAVDALLGYIHSGALASAQQMAPAMITRAENFLLAKQSQPLYAIIAAYALLKVGSANRLKWIANLADWFPLLTDGAIIYGWYLIRNGEADQARRYFRQALEHGLPMYTEGIRLLRDGLRFVSGLHPDDIDVQHDAALAYRIATAANFESVLTCLRLGHGFGMNHI